MHLRLGKVVRTSAFFIPADGNGGEFGKGGLKSTKPAQLPSDVIVPIKSEAHSEFVDSLSITDDITKLPTKVLPLDIRNNIAKEECNIRRIIHQIVTGYYSNESYSTIKHLLELGAGKDISDLFGRISITRINYGRVVGDVAFLLNTAECEKIIGAGKAKLQKMRDESEIKLRAQAAKVSTAAPFKTRVEEIIQFWLDIGKPQNVSLINSIFSNNDKAAAKNEFILFLKNEKMLRFQIELGADQEKFNCFSKLNDLVISYARWIQDPKSTIPYITATIERSHFRWVQGLKSIKPSIEATIGHFKDYFDMLDNLVGESKNNYSNEFDKEELERIIINTKMATKTIYHYSANEDKARIVSFLMDHFSANFGNRKSADIALEIVEEISKQEQATVLSHIIDHLGDRKDDFVILLANIVTSKNTDVSSPAITNILATIIPIHPDTAKDYLRILCSKIFGPNRILDFLENQHPLFWQNIIDRLKNGDTCVVVKYLQAFHTNYQEHSNEDNSTTYAGVFNLNKKDYITIIRG
ncbi:hypothetical protein ACFL52_00655 [Candidatus Margulisiibacteriota bacterium]